MRRGIAAAGALIVVLLSGIGPALAQGYPPSTNTTSAPCPSSADLGTLAINNPASADLGSFAPASNGELRVNGAVEGTVPVDANGCARITVLVTSETTVTVNGNAGLALRPAGEPNVVAVSGANASGGSTSAILAFKTFPPGQSPATTTSTTSGSGTAAPGPSSTASVTTSDNVKDNHTGLRVVMWIAIGGAALSGVWGLIRGVRRRNAAGI